ncbi:MAG TPA: AAA family ATPase, partial [Rhabdochlamydiaceae bacterium]
MAEFDFDFQLQTLNETIRSEYFVDSEHLSLKFSGKKQPSFITVELWRERDGENERYAHRIKEAATNEKSARFQSVKDFCMHLPNLLGSAIKPEPQNLILASIFKNFGYFGVASQQLQEIRVFQLNPRIARLPSAPSIHGELGRRGENLASAIDQMRLKSPKDFAQLIKWIKDIVPTFSNVLTEYTDARQLGLMFQEEGFGSRWFADDVSDGTIMGVALFYALLDKRHKTIVIEEPENTLHPWILKKFLERCREQSKGRQIFITTHSPLVVAESKPEELYLMERHDGISRIDR